MKRNDGGLRHSPSWKDRQREPWIRSEKGSGDTVSRSYSFMVDDFNNRGQSIGVGTVGKEDYATDFDLPPL